jgi:hypothetical protein
MGDGTARTILSAHDRINGTRLLASALEGKPQLCQSCHPDPGLAEAGMPGVLDFSAAMHGWHAAYMPLDGADACNSCHPSSPDGSTQCLRDPHNEIGLDCTSCHGTLEDDAVALLQAERHKPPATRLLAALGDTSELSTSPRIAWNGQPDCLNCHEDFQQPDPAASGNSSWTGGSEELYRVRTDYAGVRCPACHGPTHALYPSRNPLSRDRENVQPLQYSGTRAPVGSNGSCAVCHRKPMQDALHHPNMERPFRNAFLLE